MRLAVADAIVRQQDTELTVAVSILSWMCHLHPGQDASVASNCRRVVGALLHVTHLLQGLDGLEMVLRGPAEMRAAGMHNQEALMQAVYARPADSAELVEGRLRLLQLLSRYGMTSMQRERCLVLRGLVLHPRFAGPGGACDDGGKRAVHVACRSLGAEIEQGYLCVGEPMCSLMESLLARSQAWRWSEDTTEAVEQMVGASLGGAEAHRYLTMLMCQVGVDWACSRLRESMAKALKCKEFCLFPHTLAYLSPNSQLNSALSICSLLGWGEDLWKYAGLSSILVQGMVIQGRPEGPSVLIRERLLRTVSAAVAARLMAEPGVAPSAFKAVRLVAPALLDILNHEQAANEESDVSLLLPSEPDPFGGNVQVQASSGQSFLLYPRYLLSSAALERTTFFQKWSESLRAKTFSDTKPTLDACTHAPATIKATLVYVAFGRMPPMNVDNAEAFYDLATEWGIAHQRSMAQAHLVLRSLHAGDAHPDGIQKAQYLLKKLVNAEHTASEAQQELLRAIGAVCLARLSADGIAEDMPEYVHRPMGYALAQLLCGDGERFEYASPTL